MSLVRRNIGRIAIAISLLGVVALVLQDDDVRHAVNPFDSPDAVKPHSSKEVVGSNGNNHPSSKPGPSDEGGQQTTGGNQQTGTTADQLLPSVNVTTPSVAVCGSKLKVNCP